MLDPHRMPPVESAEVLARFILFSKWIRTSNRTVRLDAFFPHPHVELSMTRLRQATDEEIWDEGSRVATKRGTLYGRADVGVAAFEVQDLVVEAAPIPENPNHANAKNWPTEKSEQKAKALEIAIKARFLPAPK